MSGMEMPPTTHGLRTQLLTAWYKIPRLGGKSDPTPRKLGGKWRQESNHNRQPHPFIVEHAGSAALNGRSASPRFPMHYSKFSRFSPTAQTAQTAFCFRPHHPFHDVFSYLREHQRALVIQSPYLSTTSGSTACPPLPDGDLSYRLHLSFAMNTRL